MTEYENETTEKVHMVIANADKSELTLSESSIMEYVALFVCHILNLIKDAGKYLVSPKEVLKKDAAANVCKVALTKPFRSDYAMLTYCLKAVQDYLWKCVNREEGMYIKNRIIIDNDERFAHSFFLGKVVIEEQDTTFVLGIEAIASRISYEINQSNHLDMSPIKVREIIYRHLWHNGDWEPLKTYRGEGSIYAWIRTTARHEVLAELEKQGLITVTRERTAGNTRLNKISADRMTEILEDEHFPQVGGRLAAYAVCTEEVRQGNHGQVQMG